MTNQPLFRLEVFNGKTYAPVSEGTRRDLEPLFESLRDPRRLVLASKAWPPRPSYRAPTGSRGGRDRDALVADYLAWAKGAGLSSVAFYRGDFRAALAERQGLAVRYVDPAEFIGAAPAAESEEG